MAVLPGAIPDQFYFTVREDGVASQIDNFAGKQVVSLDYQGLGILRIESTGHDLLTALRGENPYVETRDRQHSTPSTMSSYLGRLSRFLALPALACQGA